MVQKVGPFGVSFDVEVKIEEVEESDLMKASSLSDFRRKSFIFNNGTFRLKKLSVHISTS